MANDDNTGAPKPPAHAGDPAQDGLTQTEIGQRRTMADQLRTRAPKITLNDFASPAEHVRNTHHAKPQSGVTIEHLLEPAYWAHVAGKMHALDEITVNPLDGGYYAVLQVRSCSKLEAVVEVLQYKEFKPLSRHAQQPGKEFLTRYGSPASGWQVIRASDKQVVKDSFIDEASAQQWLNGHLQTMAA